MQRSCGVSSENVEDYLLERSWLFLNFFIHGRLSSVVGVNLVA